MFCWTDTIRRYLKFSSDDSESSAMEVDGGFQEVVSTKELKRRRGAAGQGDNNDNEKSRNEEKKRLSHRIKATLSSLGPLLSRSSQYSKHRGRW